MERTFIAIKPDGVQRGLVGTVLISLLILVAVYIPVVPLYNNVSAMPYLILSNAVSLCSRLQKLCLVLRGKDLSLWRLKY